MGQGGRRTSGLFLLGLALGLAGMLAAACNPVAGTTPSPAGGSLARTVTAQPSSPAGLSLGTPNTVTIEGEVAVVGNEPFTALVLRLPGGPAYELVGSQEQALRSLQGTKVRVTGRPTGRQGRYAPELEVTSFARSSP